MDRGLAQQIAGQDVALRLVALAGGDLFRRQTFEHRAMFVISLENVSGPVGERFDMVADDVAPAFARHAFPPVGPARLFSSAAVLHEIRCASCRERALSYRLLPVVGVSLKST